MNAALKQSVILNVVNILHCHTATGLFAPASQIVLDILPYKVGEGLVKEVLSTSNTLHTPVPDGFYVFAAAEAERKIGACKAFLVLPVIEPVGAAILFRSGRDVADPAFFSADQPRTLV
jgi:hypothetical protein